ncbi:Uncharacterised protein [Mycobacteroides abscessus subsp. abscessus]|nr:Uncharacterised protein [Mycobacteroides abscessus subsp. abscessus]SKT62355.1 Uncharacterised protein [Mycobacteroides abscessus subsp. abscessus]
MADIVCERSRKFNPPLHKYRAAARLASNTFCGSALPSPSPSEA